MMISSWHDLNWLGYFFWSCLAFCLYGLYVRKFKNFKYFQKIDPNHKHHKPRGKCPPFFPNGWYRLMNSDQLKAEEVRYIDYCGRDIVLFRGTDGKVYALHAFCSHMGANLGIKGTVRLNQCIQCPFHGWLFDGETGNSIQASLLHNKQLNHYEYYDLKKQEKVNGEYLKNCYDGNERLKKYIVKEVNDSILIWYDSRDEFHDKVLYEPFVVKNDVEYRGESINYVNCHIQEIPENGADMRHFDFIHSSVIDYMPFLRLEWTMKSEKGIEPKLFEIMEHTDEYINNFKMKILKSYINDENKQYLNVIDLNANLIIFNKFKTFLFNGTGIQLGPGMVYIFLKSHYFQMDLLQSVTPISKFYQRVSHKFYCSSYFPYFLSAFLIYSEVRQLMSDMVIWNNKLFGASLSYNLKTEADKKLLKWRNWYSQFYEGCYEYEQKQAALDW